MNLLRQNNRSILVNNRARALFKRIQLDISKRDKNDLYNSLETIYKSFRDIYSNLGKPSVELRPFKPTQVPRSKQINLTMAEIEEDLKIAYDEVGQIGSTFVEVFNHAHALSTDLLNGAESLSSKVVDLRFLNGQLDQGVLVAGDDFIDTSKIDFAIGLQNPAADISTVQGIVTLPRTESVSIVDARTDIKVSHVKPSTLKVNPTVGNTNRFYEGNFYDYIGKARPEGGRFHLEESLSIHVPNTGITSNVIVTTQDSLRDVLDGSSIRPFVEQSLATPGAGQALRPDDIIVYDRGAGENEKKVIRSNMIDDNPASFWECEYVKTDSNIQSYVDNSRLIRPDDNGGLVAVREGEEQNVLSSSVSLDDIRNKARVASATTEDDLVVDVTVTLDKPTQLNWISINPNNFEDSAWIDVLDISYSEQDSGGFVTIPDFNNNIYDNVITDEANTELSDKVGSAILAPSKFSYKGIGVWSFEAVTAKIIKIRVRQRTAIPAPYQRLAVRLHRVFTQVYSESEADSGM